MKKDDLISTAMQIFGADKLKKLSGVGMSRVDPTDILPPRILLAQKSSALTEMVDKTGKEIKAGQFYHTGKKEIMEKFECFFLFAAKKKYVDGRKPDEGEKDMYQAIGVMKDDLSLFGMSFRSSALYALSGLFTATQSQQAPMFGFNCTVESKMLEGKLGTWYVPVIRVGDLVNDKDKFEALFAQAKHFDDKADVIINNQETENDK